MTDDRPDPDALLERVREEERRQSRGKLTIFFGAAPGVGKTYAMLEAARTERDLKRDVVIGIVETHKRYDTAALTIGLEMLPRKKLEHRGIVLEEFDIDASLARKPGLILVDELAHTNTAGSRHAKRWQDVEELLDASIDVYTTLNVQHIESLNDVVAQITGVVVRETVPDSIVDAAEEVKLVDLPTDELLERLREGKVYLPEQAGHAIDNFFRKGNLIALREIALRRTAERVDAQMRVYREIHGIKEMWPTTERLVVCVSSSPAAVRLVRAARRMAASLHAEWSAVYVETPAALRLSARDRERVAQTLRLAELLGAQVVTLNGESAADETIRYAHSRNVTKIVVGKPTHPRWRDVIGRSFLDEMVRTSGDIDVYVISGEEQGLTPPKLAQGDKPHARRWDFGAAAAAVATCTVVAWLVFGQTQLPDVVMTYLLGIVLVSMRLGYAPSLLAAMLSVLSLDFFFIPPFFSFAVSDLRHIVTFGMMLFVAVVISGLTKRIRDQAEGARYRELRTASLYSLSRDLAGARPRDTLLRLATNRVHDVFSSQVSIFLPDATGNLRSVIHEAWTFDPDEKEVGVAGWVWLRERAAGLSTETLPLARALYVPLRASGRVGVMGVIPSDPGRFVDPDQRQLLETFANQIASAIERTQLAEEARHAQLQTETERLRNSLLSSVSHDLRTPLAVVTGAATALLEDTSAAEPEPRRELLQTIAEEAQRLNRIVRNLLDMTRLEAGAVTVRKEWQPLEEVVGAALNRVEDRLRDRDVKTDLPANLSLVPLDAVLIEQVLINLLENATKYSAPGTPIEISARPIPSGVDVEILDRGSGIPTGEETRIFEKFYRAREGKGGVGLGLTICKGIVTAHGGRIWAENRPSGGAVFHFTLPIEGNPPLISIPELASGAAPVAKEA
jgi:two-component system sensor histidine kinase KdpD